MEPVDIRKGADSLALIVRESLGQSPCSGSAFAFRNKAGTRIKMVIWVEVDNNIAENALRLVSLGRKNFLFFGSDHGGERGALLYSLLGTCRLNGVDPEHYLRHVLNVIADWPVNRVSELLPWRVALPAE
ncbi:hypothetical protein CJP16_21740 [Aeromonas sobria]|uniref:Transposase IS66 C-terminal domain-containing protein n=1 Tax=Aeromonas sobria TaxID=646 RepID=A0A2N3IN23_AERSO|nr:hypothetical protein CJF47_21010 [Aeromonas sobria]PKQ72254.1 hypothetical protein CJP16_21740 [Aeromonas sobria]